MEIRPLLLGHRGARAVKSIPENTLASFDFALSSFCDGFEFDVRLTADGQPVLRHDASIRGLEISKCSARKLRLPSLRDVVSRYQRTAFLDIELKDAGLEVITVDLLHNVPPVRGFVVSSFLPDVLERVRGIDPGIPLGLICETPHQLERFGDLAADYGIFHHRLVRKDLIERMKASAKKTFVWTVNSAADMKRFSRWGADGIISDDPRLLALTLRPETTFGRKT
ncbi:MAG TPA: glycerophosphodiester phosphodiesterase [Candidatus Sulfotelmatobacter sp.]|jgi:glycerophosphoryl diester phosphodiesterase|nr:glycerophosphodiester phosphodiesterase [Candidatus Sulfotelmatobacter sp.]